MYTVGQKLELDVLEDLRKDSYGRYFVWVTDGEKNYRITNILKHQRDGELPQKMDVEVKGEDAFGHIIMRQDIQQVLNAHYITGKMYPFDITDIKEDGNGKEYYTIEDDFAEQKWYLNGPQKQEIGDSVTLICKGPNKSGWLDYKEYVSQPIAAPQPSVVAQTMNVKSTNTFCKYGPESVTTEYKTSIVYSPETHQADISQLNKIIKELVAMMNTKGGHLIIGVKDENDGYAITGIDKDYNHLNSDPNDSNTYKQNKDGYRLKILNELNYLCPMLAGSLVDFEFLTKQGLHFCVITVETSPRPIWMKGEHDLFIRQDGRIKSLRGEPLSEWIYRMMSASVEKAAGGKSNVVSLDEAELEAVVKKIINARKPDITLPPAPQRKIDYWVVWETDGTWKRQRTKAHSAFMQVPVYKNMSKPILVYCYGSGKASTMEWNVVRKGANLNCPQKANWSKNEKPKEIFIAEESSYLGVHSVDHNGIEYVKLHVLSDFSHKKNGGAVGAPVLPNDGGTKILDYKIVEVTYINSVKELVCTKAQRSTDAGTPTTSQSWSKQVAYFLALPHSSLDESEDGK